MDFELGADSLDHLEESQVYALTISHLHYRADDGVDLVLKANKGACVHIDGHDSCGRTRLFKTLMGWRPVYGGTITLFGKDITHSSIHARARLGLGLVSDNPEVFSLLSVLQNLQLAHWQQTPTKLETIWSAFPNLSMRRSILAEKLSGGEKKLLAVARARLSACKVLLLDEPILGLSEDSAIAVTSVLIDFLEADPDHTIMYSGTLIPALMAYQRADSDRPALAQSVRLERTYFTPLAPSL